MEVNKLISTHFLSSEAHASLICNLKSAFLFLQIKDTIIINVHLKTSHDVCYNIIASHIGKIFRTWIHVVYCSFMHTNAHIRSYKFIQTIWGLRCLYGRILHSYNVLWYFQNKTHLQAESTNSIYLWLNKNVIVFHQLRFLRLNDFFISANVCSRPQAKNTQKSFQYTLTMRLFHCYYQHFQVLKELERLIRVKKLMQEAARPF